MTQEQNAQTVMTAVYALTNVSRVNFEEFLTLSKAFASTVASQIQYVDKDDTSDKAIAQRKFQAILSHLAVQLTRCNRNLANRLDPNGDGWMPTYTDEAQNEDSSVPA